jgi:hypothetical protein
VKTLALLAAVILLPASLLHSAEDVVLSAMHDELARNTASLALEQLARPYFMSYAVDDVRLAEASASLGSLLEGGEQRYRYVVVELRVGDRQLDNTGFAAPFVGGGEARRYTGLVQLPRDDNYRELRRQLWLATDSAYKKALGDLARKQAHLQHRTRADDAPDFTTEAPVRFFDDVPQVGSPLDEIQRLAREVSSVFRELPEVQRATVELDATSVVRRYVNSEGSEYRRYSALADCVITAFTQAADGTPLQDQQAFFSRVVEGLPRRESLMADARSLGARLTARRAAPAAETYNGPVLFEGAAAAEVFAQAFVPHLVASPQGRFLDRLGARVLPQTVSLVDNPALEQLGAEPLMGGARVDDEGVATREVRLVEKGFLRSLLSSRRPVRSVRQSTGSRRGGGPLPSNLIVSTSEGLPLAEARAELLRRAAERGNAYGIIVRSVRNPLLNGEYVPFSGTTGEPRQEALLVYRLYPDGHEELLREAEITGITPSEFKGILAVTNEVTVVTLPSWSAADTDFGGSGIAPSLVSLAVPGLLFEEVSVKKPEDEIPRAPVARHPNFDRPGRGGVRSGQSSRGHTRRPK